jgi:hypothetical protein
MYDTRGPIPYEVFSSIAGATDEIHRAMQWWVSDLLNQAEIAHGDEYGQIAAETGMSERTLINRRASRSASPWAAGCRSELLLP